MNVVHCDSCTVTTVTCTHVCSCQQPSNDNAVHCCLSGSSVWNIVVVHLDHSGKQMASLPHLEQGNSTDLFLSTICVPLLCCGSYRDARLEIKETYIYLRFEVLMVVNVLIMVFCVVTPYDLVSSYQRF